MTPSGFGKTFLGVEWATQHPDSTVWFTGTSADTAPMMLHRMICAVRRIVPGFADWYEIAPNVDARINETIVRMCSDLAVIGKTMNFVYENMETVPTLNTPFIQTWASNLPDNCRVMSLRKNPPLISYAPQIETNSLRYLTANDLAFTDKEISELARSLGVEISDPSTENFLAKINGWPEGIIQLFNLISQHKILEINNREINTSGLELPHKFSGQSNTSSALSENVLEEVINVMIDKVFYGPRSRGGKAESLTAREAEILLMLDSNATLEVIAAKLFISKNTIKTHLKNLYRKLDVDSRDRAVVKARDLCLL